MHNIQVHWVELYRYIRVSFSWNKSIGYCSLFNLNFHIVVLLHYCMFILLAHFLQKFLGLYLSYGSPDVAPHLSGSCMIPLILEELWLFRIFILISWGEEEKQIHKKKAEIAFHIKNILWTTTAHYCLMCKLKIFQ